MSLLLSVVSTVYVLTLVILRKQIWQARFMIFVFLTSYVDEFPAQNYGMAGSPRETGVVNSVLTSK